MPDTEDRVDGRMMIELDEPGSDSLLLRGLLLRLAADKLGEEWDDEPGFLDRIRERRESRKAERHSEADPTAIDPDEPTG